MSLYLDSSALLKLYIDEPDSGTCEALLRGDPDWLTARHTEVEVRRNLARHLSGDALLSARAQFREDWDTLAVIELTPEVCALAAEIAEATGARTLDALHLGAMQRAGGGSLPFVTYDIRQAHAARSLGWPVLGG